MRSRTFASSVGPNDVIVGPNGEFFVPFAPFPAIALMPLVALDADDLVLGAVLIALAVVFSELAGVFVRVAQAWHAR